jgi:protein SCO1/2
MRSTLLLGLALIMAGCSGPSSTENAKPPLEGARIGGDFSLTNQLGQPVTDKDYAGKYRIVYFGYSFCPDICPVDLQKLMLGLAQFDKEDAVRGAKVQPLFITVDPARDTSEALKPFVERYHPRLVGLTGTPDQIAAVTKSYAVTYNKIPGSAPDRYLMAHSQLAFLMDPEGKPLALLPLDDSFTDEDEGKPELVAAELKKWVK